MSETLEDVLLRHGGQAWNSQQTACCSHWRSHRDHAAHQADAVRAWLLGQRAAVERAVRREAHDNLDRGVVSVLPRQAADAVLAVLTGGRPDDREGPHGARGCPRTHERGRRGPECHRRSARPSAGPVRRGVRGAGERDGGRRCLN